MNPRLVSLLLLAMLPAWAGCAAPSQTGTIEGPHENESVIQDSAGPGTNPELTRTLAVIAGSVSAEIIVASGNDRAVRVRYWNAAAPSASLSANVTEGRTLLGFLNGGAYGYELIDDTGTVRLTGSFVTTPKNGTWAAPEQALVRPGMALGSGYCTGGFILRDARNESFYMVTAGHCQKTLGEEVMAGSPGVPIGVVVAREYDENDPDRKNDWTLIQLHHNVSVSPSVRHYSGPSGLAVADDVAVGKTICFYGVGGMAGEGNRFEALAHQCGTLRGYGRLNQSTYVYTTVEAFGGDSGSPIIAYDSGKALAIAVGAIYGIDRVGISMCSILQRAQLSGFTLALAGAAYSPPPADPVLIPSLVPWPLAGLGTELPCSWPYQAI